MTSFSNMMYARSRPTTGALGRMYGGPIPGAPGSVGQPTQDWSARLRGGMYAGGSPTFNEGGKYGGDSGFPGYIDASGVYRNYPTDSGAEPTARTPGPNDIRSVLDQMTRGGGDIGGGIGGAPPPMTMPDPGSGDLTRPGAAAGAPTDMRDPRTGGVPTINNPGDPNEMAPPTAPQSTMPAMPAATQPGAGANNATNDWYSQGNTQLGNTGSYYAGGAADLNSGDYAGKTPQQLIQMYGALSSSDPRKWQLNNALAAKYGDNFSNGTMVNQYNMGGSGVTDPNQFQTDQASAYAWANGAPGAGATGAPTDTGGAPDPANPNPNPAAPGATPTQGAPTATGTSVPGMDPNMTSSTAAFPTFNSPYINGGQTYADPGYQFRMDEGMRGLLANKAAVGGLGSGQSLRDILNYNQDAASQEYNNAFNRFTNQQQFGYGVAQNDQNFAANQAQQDRQQADWEKQFGYNASVNDQNTNWQRQMQLANLGLSGAGGQGNINNILATLLSGNLNTQGQINATGTIGGNNALTGGLQQILQFLMQNQALNRYAPQAG